MKYIDVKTRFTYRVVSSADTENAGLKEQSVGSGDSWFLPVNLAMQLNDPRFVDDQLTYANG